MTDRLCPIDGNPLPEPSGRGRPAEFCSKVCRERARQRRRKAAKMLEFALRCDYFAAEHRAIVPRGSLTVEVLERRARGEDDRAAWLRNRAAEELRGLPL
jgi:hypothetical protein